MTAHDVEYVELYTENREETTDYFVSSFGFSETARTVTDTRNSVLLRQGDVRLMVTSGPETEDFLAAHGDGIADIALACADPDAVRDRALAAGARPCPTDGTGAPVVLSGIGDVRHTLVQRDEKAPPGVPERQGGRHRAPDPDNSDSRPPAPRLSRLDHIAVCLPAGTLHDVVDFYEKAFGFSQLSTEYVAVGDQAMDSVVVRSPSGRATFTIIEPDPAKQPGQIDEFLRRNGGGGVQHLAFLVDEIVPAVLDFEVRGVEFLQTPNTYYDALADRISGLEGRIADLRKANVLADRDEWGYLLQLFTRSPYERRTLFFELIQRQGAQGFGSSNIRALYEAVERSRQLSS